jgi:hypothetical protein
VHLHHSNDYLQRTLELPFTPVMSRHGCVNALTRPHLPYYSRYFEQKWPFSTTPNLVTLMTTRRATVCEKRTLEMNNLMVILVMIPLDLTHTVIMALRGVAIILIHSDRILAAVHVMRCQLQSWIWVYLRLDFEVAPRA